MNPKPFLPSNPRSLDPELSIPTGLAGRAAGLLHSDCGRKNQPDQDGRCVPIRLMKLFTFRERIGDLADTIDGAASHRNISSHGIDAMSLSTHALALWT